MIYNPILTHVCDTNKEIDDSFSMTIVFCTISSIGIKLFTGGETNSSVEM